MYGKKIIGLGGVRKIRSIKKGDLFKYPDYDFVYKIIRKTDEDKYLAERYYKGKYEGENYLSKVLIQNRFTRVYKNK